MKYDVTIGVPVYQAAAFLRQTLESILAQSYPSIEFLFVDDGSSDQSLSILKEYQSNHHRGGDIRIVSHAQNEGVAASRNHIIEEARGKFLYFMDADDRIACNTIELLIRQVRLYDLEVAFGSYEKIDLDGKRTVYQYPELLLLGEDKLAGFAYRKFGGIQASACNYLVKTSLLHKHHHHFVRADFWEDLVFTFDLVTLVSRSILLPDITYTYQCHENSLSHYQERRHITKSEILKNVSTINHLKLSSSCVSGKEYYANRCYNIAMMGVYMACSVLNRRNEISPDITDDEIKKMLRHPSSFRMICSFRQHRIANLLLFIISKLPSSLCVFSVWAIEKMKKVL